MTEMVRRGRVLRCLDRGVFWRGHDLWDLEGVRYMGMRGTWYIGVGESRRIWVFKWVGFVMFGGRVTYRVWRRRGIWCF